MTTKMATTWCQRASSSTGAVVRLSLLSRCAPRCCWWWCFEALFRSLALKAEGSVEATRVWRHILRVLRACMAVCSDCDAVWVCVCACLCALLSLVVGVFCSASSTSSGRFNATQKAPGRSDQEAIQHCVHNRKGDFYRMVVARLAAFRRDFFAL
jgi:hypothetical protein